MRNGKIQRFISMLLCLAMLVGNVPMVGHAAENHGLCEHHTEHLDCGYEEGVSGCGYVCQLCTEDPTPTTEPVAPTTEPVAPTTEPVAPTTEPVVSDTEPETQPVCTGLADCAAENHSEGCEKAAAEQNASDREAAEAVLEQIEALPTLEEIQAKPMAEQKLDYEQVQKVYGDYCALTEAQQALLPAPEEVFKPYFDYFNSLVSMIWSGSGTQSSPYSIRSEQELRDLATQVKSGKTYSGTYFRLDTNITLTSDWTPIGTETYAFLGSFDGNGKTITGLTATGNYVGLFAYVGSGAVIKNVTLAQMSLSGDKYVAGLIAHVNAGSGTVTISDCHVSGELRDSNDDDGGIEDGYLGGIVAYADATSGSITISGCTASGSMSCDTNSGGIIGYGKGTSHSLKLRYCTNRMGIGAGSNSNACGGIAGNINSAEVVACVNYGGVSGNAYSEDNGSSWLGGIAGSSSGSSYIGCANYAGISTFFAGGITPAQYGNSYVECCLNTGKMTNSSDGYGRALIYHGTVVNSYYLSGTGTGSTGATAASASEMASGAVAHALRDYFGQIIGTDSYPVPLTASNRVYKVTVVGDVTGTYYVNTGKVAALPTLSACSVYFDGDNEFDPSTPITRDYALLAKGFHSYVDGVCTECGKEGVNYLGMGSCGASLSWMLTETGVLTISGTGAMADYTSASATPWNKYSSQVKQIVIEKGVTSLGNHAFQGLSNVTALTFGDTTTSIGDYTFSGCTGLTSLTLGGNLQTLGSYAFSGCTGLTALTVGDRLVSVGSHAFDGCSNLYDITWGDCIQTIGDYAFYNCVTLCRASFPNSLTSIGTGAFQGCRDVETIWLGSGVKTIGASAFVGTNPTSIRLSAALTSLGSEAFAGCSSLGLIIFNGSDAPTVGTNAFRGVTAQCTVPNYTSNWAGKVNQNYGGTLTWSVGSGTCGANAQWVVDFTGTLRITGTGEMYDYNYSNSPWYSVREQVKTVVIEPGITTIGDYAFYGCDQMTSITIPEGVKSVGEEWELSYSCPFGGCTSLTSITFPASMNKLAYDAFIDCPSLTSIQVASGSGYYSSVDGILYDRYQTKLVHYPAGKTATSFTIPSGVTAIGQYAFLGNENLTEVTIPASVTSIAKYAFEDCYQLNHVIFQGSAPTIDTSGFRTVTATVDYPTADASWVGKIGNYGGKLTWNSASGTCGTNVNWKIVYNGANATLVISGTGAMSNYTSSTIPWKDHLPTIQTVEVQNGVTSVGDYAFYMASALTKVTLADSVTSIGNNAFTSCTKLYNLKLSNKLKTIGDSAFSSTGVSTLHFPDTLQSVGRNSFTYCTSLKELSFGSGMQTIGYTAFGQCTALTSVDLGSSVTTLDQSAFNGCSKLTTMVIPASVTSVGMYAFRNCTNLRYVEFLGNAPTITADAFNGTTCCAFYSPSATGWTSSKLSNYGGTLTWGAISQRGTCGSNAEWFLDNAGNLILLGSGSMYSYSESSPAPWHNYRSSIKTVSFKGVTSIGAYAFRDCPNLEVVLLEGSAPSIGTNAFLNTTCEVWYPSSYTYSSSVKKDYGGTVTWRATSSRGKCGTNAYWGLDTAGNLVILGSGSMSSYSTTTMPWYSSLSSVKNVIIGDGITSLGSYSFYNHTALASATVGAGVTSVGSYAFSGCTALTNITFRGSAPTFSGSYVFRSVVATANYPMVDTTWTTSKRQNYGGTITWVAVCTNHNIVIDSAVAATCTTDGKTEGKHCTICGEALVPQTVIPALGHYALNDSGVEVKASTLQADCVKDIMCTVCQKVAIPAAGHRITGTTLVETDPLTISADRFTLTSGTYYSTNTSNSSTSALTITAKYDCSLTLTYGVSSEEDYDKLIIYLNGTTKATISGEVSNQTMTLQLKAGDKVVVNYKKDNSDKDGQDKGWVKLTYDNVMAEGLGDVPAETGEPDCLNGVICKYCDTQVKPAAGHRVQVPTPAPENLIQVVNNSTYPFTQTNGTYYSGNRGKSSTTSTMQLKVLSDCDITLTYGVSSEANYDKLTISYNGTAKDTISGAVSGKSLTLNAKTGDLITVSYSKDGSTDSNQDRGWVSFTTVGKPVMVIVPADEAEATCAELLCYYCQAKVKDALGHSWDEGTVTVPATEISEGEMLHSCVRCGETKTEVISKLPHEHKYEPVVTAPTCTEDGFTTYTCSVCSDSYTDDAVSKLGHTGGTATCKAPAVCTRCSQSYGDVDPTAHSWQAATCETAKTCSLCGATEGEALGHSYTGVVTDPTCTEDGYTTYTCSRCSDSYTDDTVTKLGHSMGDWVVTKDATCEEDGEKRRDCDRCDYFEAEEIAAAGHKHEAVVTAPTCTEDGYTTYTCSVCNDTYTDDPVSKLGHSMGDWVTAKDATCTEDGEKRRDCDRCDYFEAEEIAAQGHKHQTKVTAPTCTEDGYTTYTCSVCNDTYTGDPVSKLGHSMGDWVVTKDATCEEDGEKRRDCGRCDHFETEVITAQGHDWLAATCKAPKTCDICGATEGEIDPNGHNRDEKNTCTLCGHIGGSCGAEGQSVIWTLKDGVLTVSGTGEMADYGLFEDQAPWSVNADQITFAVIESGVTSIGDAAFYGLGKMTGTDIADTVTRIGSHAFNTTGLETVTIPGSVKTVGDYAFGYSENLKEITVEDGVVSFGEYAFGFCPALETVTLGEGVTDIAFLFEGCSKLQNVTLPDTLTSIGAHAFAECASLKTITVPDSVKTVDAGAFLGCYGLESIVLPEGVETVGAGAFAHCSKLTTVVIPASVTKLETNVFGGCSSLKEIWFGGTEAQWDAIKENVPAMDFVHYSCAGPENHWKSESVDPTCEAAGYTQEVCACGYERNHVTTGAALGHQLGQWTTTKDTTCTEDGEKRRDCDRCDYFETEVITAAGHKHEAVVTAPTCTEDGYTTYTCICGDTYTDDVVSKLGHTYEDGVCTACGGEDPDYVAPVKITKQPTNAIAANGATVTTTVTATGTGLTYQWYYKSATSSSFVKSSQTTATYSTTMNARRNGYKVYCVITDAIGNTVTSDTVTLTMTVSELKIITQPTNAEAADGATVSTKVVASGEGLKYQWYYKSATSSVFVKSSQTTATYSTTMNAQRNGYKVYCVITDVSGKSVTSNTVTLSMSAGLKITLQPCNAAAAKDQTIGVVVLARGEGLKYQWYFKSASASAFSKSSTTTAFYSTTMTAARDGYKVYCVITDANGKSVTSNTVTLTMNNSIATPLKLTAQPVNASAASGADVTVKVVASGEGLKYQWYYKSATSSSFVKSSNTTAIYSTTMNSTRDGYKVYCMVTDQYGNSVKSNTVTLSMKKTLKITTQPTNQSAADGATVSTKVVASGDGLKYQWYFKSATASSFSKSSTTTATYSTTMTSARNGYQVYCVVTDKYGNSVKTDTVTLTME